MHPVTYYGLHEWHKSAFEKLGWMTLAAKDTDSVSKIPAYFMELMHLETALDTKIAETQEEDRKNDLKILKNQVVILQSAAKKLFPTLSSGGRKKRI